MINVILEFLQALFKQFSFKRQRDKAEERNRSLEEEKQHRVAMDEKTHDVQQAKKKTQEDNRENEESLQKRKTSRKRRGSFGDRRL